ncbi:unnamed protein product [Orchesella dallaii]|uniref:CRAL-TRIO domain-containing protein n=1 Tax=Orchesella dallaii TaxID=48710 RepID=A0ABP1QDZ1_9HEXA
MKPSQQSFSAMRVTTFTLLKVFMVLAFAVSVKSVSFDEDVTISYTQKVSIDKLRQRVLPYIVEGYMKDDIYLVKWLRAANFDVRRAEKMFLENVRWRKASKLQTIEKEDFSDISDEYPYVLTGLDKQGRPVFVAMAGEWNIRNAIMTGRAPRVLRYLDQGLEVVARDIRRMQREGKNVTQANLIIDLNQFSVVTHACVQCLIRILDFLSSYETHFPGMAHRIIFTNAPPAVQFVLDLVRQNCSKETRAAMKVFDTNRQRYEKALRELIDVEYIPEELGGKYERN